MGDTQISQREKNSNEREGKEGREAAKISDVEIKDNLRKLPGFHMLRKGFSTPKDKIFYLENLKDGRIKNFKHMKSILGHISVAEENLINPVAIYCICFSNDNELIFTGDNNG